MLFHLSIVSCLIVKEKNKMLQNTQKNSTKKKKNSLFAAYFELTVRGLGTLWIPPKTRLSATLFSVEMILCICNIVCRINGSSCRAPPAGGGGGAYSLIWAIRGRAAGQGMVFWPRCPKQGVRFEPRDLNPDCEHQIIFWTRMLLLSVSLNFNYFSGRAHTILVEHLHVD